MSKEIGRNNSNNKFKPVQMDFNNDDSNSEKLKRLKSFKTETFVRRGDKIEKVVEIKADNFSLVMIKRPKLEPVISGDETSSKNLNLSNFGVPCSSKKVKNEPVSLGSVNILKQVKLEQNDDEDKMEVSLNYEPNKEKFLVDTLIRNALKSGKIAPGVNVLSYEEQEGVEHFASLLPNGQLQDSDCGEVFKNFRMWIKYLNHVPKRAKAKFIETEIRRVKYKGIHISNLISSDEKVFGQQQNFVASVKTGENFQAVGNKKYENESSDEETDDLASLRKMLRFLQQL